MKKWIALTALMLVALLTLSGCNLIGYDEELDNAQVVAKVNDTEITKAEWKNYTEYLAYYYQQYYQQYFGISLSMTDEDVAAYGESALEQLIQSRTRSRSLAMIRWARRTPLRSRNTPTA